MPSSFGASASGAAMFVVTTNNHTIIQQPAEDSIPNACSMAVTPTRFADLMQLPHRERPRCSVHVNNHHRRNSPVRKRFSLLPGKMRRRTKRRNAMISFRRRAQRTVRSGRSGAKSVCRNRKSLQLPSVKMCIGLNCVILSMVIPQIHSPRMNGKIWRWWHNNRHAYSMAAGRFARGQFRCDACMKDTSFIDHC